MAIDITGITNENEFYTHHYLSAILENDLKAVFKKWKRQEDEEEVGQPYIRLRSLRKEYFTTHALLAKEKNTGKRLTIQREFLARLLDALGYQYHPQLVELDDGTTLPLIGGITRADGSPELWIIEALTSQGEENDPLELPLVSEQYGEPEEEITKILKTPLEEIITRQVFGRTEPPRWVILLSFSQLLLLDRSKWHEKRLLRFDIREILDRRETSTLQATTALLHRDSICPKDGIPLLDTLDENSHKHAFAVSEDLKYSLRKAIELLGNEAVWYLQETLHEKTYGKDMAGQLTRECLRYMYRLLFLFYIEARPELGYLPNKSKEYRKGYSLESLRDLEMVQLSTEESKNRFFLHESIRTLFHLLYDGFEPKQQDMFAAPDHNTFRISPLRSHLFDPAQTPLLNKVKFRNFVLQEIIELMSLTRPKKGKNKKNRRGRISYAQLGINQLGAVYEALLSYQGFFAETELFEVKKAKDKHNVLETAYFVKAEDIEQYTEDERVYNTDGSLTKYEKGAFIYRLAGRDRQKSASYYTPEVLTKCLVKYALKELLKDKTADEIIELTVCEPAMGSAAFLNEAINQLAKAYLVLKQQETGENIPHDQYPRELQKVKMYIADNNVYGVDLNPVAVELAEVSLWLNTIYEGAFVPWFGMQLVCGNSLIGARRQVFDSNLVKKGKRGDPSWLDAVPERVMPGEKRQARTIYHFLLPDKSMAAYKDKVIKQMAGEEIKVITEWRKEFTQPFTESEIKQLQNLSTAIDKLWQRHVEMQQDIDRRTTDPLQVFGQLKPDKQLYKSTTEKKDRIFQKEMFSKDVRNSSPYRRLKLVMDYWCALWFWPIEKADLLPSRAEYLFDLTLLLEGNIYDAEAEKKGQKSLFPDTQPKQISFDMVDEFGFVNVDKLCQENPRLRLVRKLGEQYRFLHWELEFADLFARQSGFDLVLGNPPWKKLTWYESSVLGDANPIFVLRKYTASKLANLRNNTINDLNLKSFYLFNFEEAEGTQNYLNSLQNYPLLRGVQTNLYKCFMPQAWMIGNSKGVSSFLHPEGVYDDPKGKLYREKMYSRLKYHFQFQNEARLFPIAPVSLFSINIYGSMKDQINFVTISNLYHPKTVDSCYEGSMTDKIPGVKTEDNKLQFKGHPARIIEIGLKELDLFAKLYDKDSTRPLQARLPVIHSRQILKVIGKFGDYQLKLGDIQRDFYSTVMWDETNAIKKDKTIKRETHRPIKTKDFILSGPNFHVGNPLAKCPWKKCRQKEHYSVIDLEKISEYYISRSNYIPDVDYSEYQKRLPRTPWDKEKTVVDYYRFVNREMIGSNLERTLVPIIIFKGAGHINTCLGTCFKEVDDLINFYSLTLSVPVDFRVKSTGMGHANTSLINQLPIIDTEKIDKNVIDSIRIRSLALNCLTGHYKELWEKGWSPNYQVDKWGKNDSRLADSFFHNLSSSWSRESALRIDFERRQALVEIDVLASMIIGLTLDELKEIYSQIFFGMKNIENNTYYDQKGRITFIKKKGFTGIGFPRKKTKTEPIGWEDIKDLQSGIVERTITDDTQSGDPVERTITYHAPFDRCNREKDYEEVWANFEKRFGGE